MPTLVVWIVQVVIALLMLIGSAFVLLSGLGMVTMPDVYLRISAATKAGTAGVGGLLIAAALVFADDSILVGQVLATLLFVFFTAPVAAHMIGRAAYVSGITPDKSTIQDDLHEYYSTHGLLHTGEPLDDPAEDENQPSVEDE